MEQLDINKILEEGDKNQVREAQSLQRSLKIRKSSEFISENAMKIRKAFFCNETTGFLSRDVKTI